MNLTEHDRTGEALGCLNEALEATGLGRKQQADLVGESEPGYRKMVSGYQAFGLDVIERLPDAVIVDFLTRWGKVRGFRVEALDIDAQLMETLQVVQRATAQLVQLQRLRDVQMRPAKAGLAVPVIERRRA